MPVILSTASADIQFNFFPKKVHGPTEAVNSVLVKGGAGVQNKKNFETPRGVATVVSDKALEALRQHPLFQEMESEGYFFVEEKEVRIPSEGAIEERVDSDMADRDSSAQDTKEDLMKDHAKVPMEEEED